MSDDQGMYSPAPEAGQLSGNVPQQGQPVEPQQPAYVTVDQFEEALQRITRTIQSATDKQESRITKKLDTWQKALARDGITPTPAMVEQARQQVAFDMLSSLPDDDEQPAPVAPDPQLSVKIAQVNRDMTTLKRQFGFELTPDDDEFADVNFSDPKPERFYSRWTKAMEAKRQRLAQPTNQPTGSPAARMPGLAQGAASGDRYTEIVTRLNALQHAPDALRNRANADERKKLVAELEALGR